MTQRIRDFFRLRRTLTESNRKLGAMLAESFRRENAAINALAETRRALLAMQREREMFRALAELHAGARVTGESLPEA